MTVRCPICFHECPGDVEANIAPGDELADHLTDAHPSASSKLFREGVEMDV